MDHSGNIYVASDDPGRGSVLREKLQLSPIVFPRALLLMNKATFICLFMRIKSTGSIHQEKKLFMPVQALQFKPVIEEEQQNLIDRLTLP